MDDTSSATDAWRAASSAAVVPTCEIDVVRFEIVAGTRRLSALIDSRYA